MSGILGVGGIRLRSAKEQPPTLVEAVDSFLAQPDLADSSRRYYTQTLGRLRRELGPERPLQSVSGRELDQAVVGTWGACAPATWNRHLATLRSFSTFCARQGWVSEPLVDVLARRREPADRTDTARGRSRSPNLSGSGAVMTSRCARSCAASQSDLIRSSRRRVGRYAVAMPTLVFDPPPAELEAVLERRRRSGADRHDEVWEGVLHMIPPPSVEHERLLIKLGRLLGPHADAAQLEITGGIAIGADKGDYRVPDLTLLRPGSQPQWNDTAALVVEIVSPKDTSWDKLPFYAAHQVDELVIVDPAKRSVDWLVRAGDRYESTGRSGLIELGPEQLAEQLDWPAR
ncbi:MAG: Uma2 family endonuclease [Solirubrobacteraceae bacterium]